MRLDGKVAIVAGAAWGGIGAATAYKFACEGAKVVVNTRRREAKTCGNRKPHPRRWW